MPDLSAAVVGRIGALARELRARGVRIGVGELLTAQSALAAVDASSREDAFYALRTTLCSASADLAVFPEAYAAVFGIAAPGEGEAAPTEAVEEEQPAPHAAVPDSSGGEAEDDAEPAPAAWSDAEILRRKDFAEYTDADRLAARRLIARLAQRMPQRRSRRMRPVRGRGTTPDVRATVRSSLRHGGELVHRRWRGPSQRPRRLVLVCDVSGSMAPHARMLLTYVQAAVAAHGRVEAFAFGTRLTRLTMELAGRDPEAAIERATTQLEDWSGGTRIGAALGELNRVHGRRIGRGAIVVVLSDGWDRGDPDELAAEMARLQRSAHRVLWCNPLAAHPDYEPLTRGMQAALPSVDRLLAGNSIASLEELAALLEEGFATAVATR
jgi:uncharacterized protein with von Willebrand factor type A (vWA) domain